MVTMKKNTTIIISSIVVVVILTTLILPIVDVYSDKKITYWQYDDYREIEGNHTVDGEIFEIVSINDKQYIHAKSVGNGTIDGKETTVSKATLDLIFMCGQSNAAYRNPDPEQVTPVPKLGTAYYFGLSDRSGPTAAENNTGMDISSCEFYSMINPSNGYLRIGDKGPSFSAEYNSITGHKIYWVCGAIGNKSISQFLPPNGFMWEYMNNMLEAAVNAVDTDCFDLNAKYYLWGQGEANAASSISSYKTTFLAIHNALLNGDCANQKFIAGAIIQTRAANGGNATIAQKELTEEYPTILMGSTAANTFTVANGLMGSDDLHYSQLGNNILGTDVGKLLGKIVNPYEDQYGSFRTVISIVPLIIIAALIFNVARYFVNRNE